MQKDTTMTSLAAASVTPKNNNNKEGIMSFEMGNENKLKFISAKKLCNIFHKQKLKQSQNRTRTEAEFVGSIEQW